MSGRTKAKKPINYQAASPVGSFIDREEPGSGDMSSGSAQTHARTDAQPSERVRFRNSFDIYKDQYEDLLRLQVEAHSRTGKKPNISDLVKEALDEYLEKRRE